MDKAHRLTQEALRRLNNDGIVVDPMDAIELDLIARRTDKASDQKLMMHSGRWAGNVEVFPLTLGAKVWLKEDALEWFRDDEDVYYVCFLYAMVNAKYPEKFVFKDARECRRAILKWSRTVNASGEEIASAIGDTIETRSDADGILKDLVDSLTKDPTVINLVPALKFLESEASGHDEGSTPIVAWLMANLGKDEQHWLWERPWDEVESLLSAAIKNASTDERIDAKDPSIMAMRKFRLKVEEIRRKGVNNG